MALTIYDVLLFMNTFAHSLMELCEGG